MYFAVPAGHEMKMKESNNISKNMDLGRELKSLRNMRVTVILIVVGGLEQSPGAWKRDWRNWKSEEESRPYRPQHC